MNNNYLTIKKQIQKYSFEKLKNNKEILERFELLYQKNNTMIHNSVKPQLISAGVIYSYLREHKLNGKSGITMKDLAQYFDITTNAVSEKTFNIDCIINKSAIFPEQNYEFIDKDRFEVSGDFFNFMDSDIQNDYKKSEKKLKSLIKKDPYFFDTYTTLHEYYLENNEIQKAFNLMSNGYNRALFLINNKGRFPDSLPWLFTQNRHIIRIIFNFATLLWLADNKKDALDILLKLLKSNPNDNIGARYCIVGLLEGFESFEHMEEEFSLDWQKQEKWFNKSAKKYKKIIGWWFELEF